MYSDSDFERFYVGYMVEAMRRGALIQAYCKKNNVPYNLFDKWYTDTRLMVVPVTVKGGFISTPTLGNHSGAV